MVNSQLYETVLVSCSVADNMYLIVWIMIIGVDKKSYANERTNHDSSQKVRIVENSCHILGKSGMQIPWYSDSLNVIIVSVSRCKRSGEIHVYLWLENNKYI